MANCTKRRFRTELDARIALFSTSTKANPRRQEQRYYKCPGCHGWHLTSQPKKGAKA